MSRPPKTPKIYHITHVDNLASIASGGEILSDANTIEQGITSSSIGMSNIKRRRLEELEVWCHPGTMVGEYVPFYFCPRSIMLYILHRKNYEELTYRGGQEPIVHLVADLHTVVEWCDANDRGGAFTPSNAGAFYTDFYSDRSQLEKIDWRAVRAHKWSETTVKEGKQAEFLCSGSFPWELVERIGVIDAGGAKAAKKQLDGATHVPSVVVRESWYYS